MGKVVKKTKERSYAIYVKKLLAAHNTRAPATVVAELEKMMVFLLTNTTDAMRTIAMVYDKKNNTARPKLAQAALQALLEGELQQNACAAGASALGQFLANKTVEKKKKTSASRAAVDATA